MLTQREVGPYLMERTCLKAADIVDGAVEIVDASRRNCNFRIVNRNGPSYLVKQGVGPEGLATVAHEAAIYRYSQSGNSIGLLASCLPVFHYYDEENGVLILQLLDESENMQEYHARRRRFPAGLAAKVGSVLARLHSPVHGPGNQPKLTTVTPWVLSIHRPHLAILREISGGHMEMTRIVQSSSELCRNLDELRMEWKTDALIHQDLKGENIVVFARSDGRRGIDVRLVDWECATYGDAGWDVGSLFGEYLCSWLFSIPSGADEQLDRAIALAQCPLEKMQPAILSFWRAYSRAMRFDRAAAQQRLIRSVRYAAARMLQTACESLQNTTRMTAGALAVLQVSSNILQRPLEASIHLLGIPLTSSAE